MTPLKIQTAMIVRHDDTLETAVVTLLNDAVSLRKRDDGRLELECKMCGQRDESHTGICPVPALERWLNS